MNCAVVLSRVSESDGRSGGVETVQDAHVFRVDGVLEELAAHFEEGGSGEEGIRAGLVLRSYPRDL